MLARGRVFSVTGVRPETMACEVFRAVAFVLVTFPSGRSCITMLSGTGVLTDLERHFSPSGENWMRAVRIRSAMACVVDLVNRANARHTLFRRPVRSVRWLAWEHELDIEQYGGWNGRRVRRVPSAV